MLARCMGEDPALDEKNGVENWVVNETPWQKRGAMMNFFAGDGNRIPRPPAEAKMLFDHSLTTGHARRTEARPCVFLQH